MLYIPKKKSKPFHFIFVNIVRHGQVQPQQLEQLIDLPVLKNHAYDSDAILQSKRHGKQSRGVPVVMVKDAE